jgi:hypothetical protein
MKISPVKSALIGGLGWICAALTLRPSPLELKWGMMLFLLAPLVLMPLGMSLATPQTRSRLDAWLWECAFSMQLPAAILLAPAFVLPEGLLAGGLSLPWLLVTAAISLSGVVSVCRRGFRPPEECSVDAGKIFLVVGGIWVALSRLGVRPVNFEPVIVLLTGIHFHYAGFLLPLMTGLAGRLLQNRLARVAALGVILGVPLTALGITTSQLGLGHAPEMLAALMTAGAGALTAGLHFKLALRRSQPRIARFCWLILAISLSCGVLLAALYGSRFYTPMAWLDIPWMRALHGSANALGFGLFGVIGWYLHKAAGEKPPRAMTDLPG